MQKPASAPGLRVQKEEVEEELGVVATRTDLAAFQPKVQGRVVMKTIRGRGAGRVSSRGPNVCRIAPISDCYVDCQLYLCDTTFDS